MQYQLLILHTHRHFTGRVWLAYDQAFQEHAVAARLTDWSYMNVQLFTFHAAEVVWLGCTFLQQMKDLLCFFLCRDHPIRLNSEFHLELQWWHGVSFWLYPGVSAAPDLEVTSAAAGSLAFGRYF